MDVQHLDRYDGFRARVFDVVASSSLLAVLSMSGDVVFGRLTQHHYTNL